MRPLLIILVLFAVAESGKLKSEFFNPENSSQDRAIKTESKHLASLSLGLTNFLSAVENIAGKVKEKFGQTQELAQELGNSLGSIKDKFININSDLKNAIQDEFEKTTSNNSDNPQARLILGPIEVELDVDLDLGPVEHYIKNKPGLTEIAEDIGNTVGTIKDEVGNTVAKINEQVEETFADINEQVEETVENINEQVEETVEDINELNEDVEEKVATAAFNIIFTVGNIQYKVEKTVDSVKDKLGNIVGTITDTVDKIKFDEDVQNAVGNAIENINKAVENAINKEIKGLPK